MSVNIPVRGSLVGVRPPICGICTPGAEPRIVLVQRREGVRHWPNEGHIKPVKLSPDKKGPPVTKSGNALPKTCNECGKVVTRRKVCNACRQAAYRERRAK